MDVYSFASNTNLEIPTLVLLSLHFRWGGWSTCPEFLKAAKTTAGAVFSMFTSPHTMQASLPPLDYIVRLSD